MKKTKIACVYHSIDLDGWMSAAIVKLALKDESPVNFIGYNYGQPVPDLSEYNEIIMCDISFPKEIMEELKERLGSNFVWIDHHISAISGNNLSINGLRDVKFAACELTWKYFFPEPDGADYHSAHIPSNLKGENISLLKNEMPEIVRLLGLYDSFRHKNTDEEQKVLEFQYGARERITDVKSAYDVLCITKDEKLHMGGQYFDNYINQIYDAGKAIYRYLCTDAKQSYKNGVYIYLQENSFDEKGELVIRDIKIRNFICINKERFNPINFGIDYHAEGYDGAMCWHLGADKMVNISFYNDNKEVDCSAIAKSFGGGGHRGAAGCRMTLEKFSRLIS